MLLVRVRTDVRALTNRLIDERVPSRFYCDSPSDLDEHISTHKGSPHVPEHMSLPLASSILTSTKLSEPSTGGSSEKSSASSKAKVHRCRQCPFVSSVKVQRPGRVFASVTALSLSLLPRKTTGLIIDFTFAPTKSSSVRVAHSSPSTNTTWNTTCAIILAQNRSNALGATTPASICRCFARTRNRISVICSSNVRTVRSSRNNITPFRTICKPKDTKFSSTTMSKSSSKSTPTALCRRTPFHRIVIQSHRKPRRARRIRRSEKSRRRRPFSLNVDPRPHRWTRRPMPSRRFPSTSQRTTRSSAACAITLRHRKKVSAFICFNTPARKVIYSIDRFWPVQR